ncbi:MAG TPA: hypothetical protein VGM46_07080, partial [Mesorhizobium sp.]
MPGDAPRQRLPGPRHCLALDIAGRGLYFRSVFWILKHGTGTMTTAQDRQRPQPRAGIMDIEAYVPGKS